MNGEITSQVFDLSSEKHISVHSKVKEIWVQSYILLISHYLLIVCDDTYMDFAIGTDIKCLLYKYKNIYMQNVF